MAEKKADKWSKFEKFESKDKALEAALAQIEKSFGKGAVMKLGDNNKRMNVEVTPTGCLSIDVALGVGGIPKGRIIEIFGPESSGKTTVALHMVAEVQKAGGIAGYIDAEHAMDPVYAQKIGVNINELYISQPDDGEQALEIVETMVRSQAMDIIVVDSVAALVPRAEIEGEMGDSHMGLQARLMSQALRKLTGIVSRSKCTVIFINQLREKIGVTFGNPETTTGGRALKFYASVRLDIRKAETLKIKEDFVGNRTKIKVVKNKVAPPFKTGEFDIMYGHGISREGDVLDLAVGLDIAVKSGSWFSYKETRIGQGRENAKIFLQEHPDMCIEMENEVREKYGLPCLKPDGTLDFVPADSKEEDKKKEAKKETTKKEAAKKTDSDAQEIDDLVENIAEEAIEEEIDIVPLDDIEMDEITISDEEE